MESNYLYSPDFDIDIDYDIEMKKELMDGEIQHSLVWKECFGDKEKESSLGYRAEIDANLNRAGKRRDRENEDYLIKQPVQIDMKKDIKLDPVETAEEFNSNADPLLDLETIRPHGSKNEGTIIMKDENVLQSNNSSNEEIELEAEKARNESASDSGLEDDADSSDEEYVPSSVWQKQKKSKRKDKPKSVECTVCDYSCSEPSRLLRHMRSHTKEKNYLCTLCDFKCYQSADLRLHLRTHTREKLFHCEFCDYSTGLNKNLVRHVKIHTDDKRHACSICDYSSIEAADLRAHMYKHSGLKPFSCKLCDYRGAKSSDLVKHVRIHTGERPYRCTQCDYCAARSYHLKIHLARHAAKSKSSKNRKK